MRIECDEDGPIVAHTTDADETRDVAARLSGALRGGEALGLRGDLGAGKTVFVQGLAHGLGSCDPVTSPSFVIAHEYRGRVRLHHIDLYRLDCGHVDDLGLEDLIAPDAVLAVEWSERLPDRLRRLLSLEIAIECGECEFERRLAIVAPQRTDGDLMTRIAQAFCRPESLPAEAPEA